MSGTIPNHHDTQDGSLRQQEKDAHATLSAEYVTTSWLDDKSFRQSDVGNVSEEAQEG